MRYTMGEVTHGTKTSGQNANKRLKLAPPSSEGQTTPFSGEHEESWLELRDDLIHLLNDEPTRWSYEEQYRMVYNFVHYDLASMLHQSVFELLTQFNLSLVNQLTLVSPEQLLYEVGALWRQYHHSIQLFRDIFLYMDKYHAKKKLEGKLQIFDVARTIFLEVTLRDEIWKPLIEATFKELKKLRLDNTCTESHEQLKTVCKMLIDLRGDHIPLDMYRERFEPRLLTETKLFYQQMGAKYSKDTLTPGYLKKVEGAIQQEMELASGCFHEQSIVRVKACMQDVLVQANLEQLLSCEQSGLISMMENNQYTNLKLLHTILKDIDGAAPIVCEKIKAHLIDKGQRMISKFSNNSCNTFTKAGQKCAISFSNVLLAFRKSCGVILHQSFASDVDIRHAINIAFRSFINENQRASEYLACYLVLEITQSHQLHDKRLTKEVEDFTTLFRYLNDKVSFESWFRRRLANVLLKSDPLPENTLTEIITALQNECGAEYTLKMQGMIKDVIHSKKETAEFTKDQPLKLNAKFNVVEKSNWPSPDDDNAAWLPHSLRSACTAFQTFYEKRHRGRKLVWHPSLCSGELTFQTDTCRRILQVSGNQMIVLLAFNSYEQLTQAEIQFQTGMTADVIQATLQTLTSSNCPLLTFVKDAEPIVYTVNGGFRSARMHVAVPQAAETGKQDQVVEQVFTANQKYVLDARIIRIMKQAKKLSQPEILSKVHEDLSAHFVPIPAEVRKRIDSLVQRDFLEKLSEGDSTSYQYVA